MHLSQPAVSLHVKDLERHLSVTLFERVGRDVRLTEAGRVVQSFGRRLLDLSLELERAAEETKGADLGRLVVGASTTPSYLLPVVLGLFRERCPGISVAVEIGNTTAIADLIRRDELHLGFLGGEAADDLDLEPWVEDHLALILPPGHRWTGDEIDPESIADEPFVAREQGSATDELTRRALDAAGVSPRVTLVLGNTEAVKGAVARGLGVAFVSAGAVVHEIATGQLAQCTVRGIHIERMLQIARRKGRGLTAPEESFIAVALESRERLPSVSRRIARP